MRRMVTFLFALVVALAFSVGANAMEKMQGAKVSGEVVSDDGEFIEIKTAAGEMKKYHKDKTTKMTGMVKAGAQVEIEAHESHAMSVTVAAAEAAPDAH